MACMDIPEGYSVAIRHTVYYRHIIESEVKMASVLVQASIYIARSLTGPEHSYITYGVLQGLILGP